MTVTIGLSTSKGETQAKTVYHEFTAEMSAGFPSGAGVSISATMGEELTQEVSEEVGQDVSKEESWTFWPKPTELWQWQADDQNSDDWLGMKRFAQTQDSHWPPACLPGPNFVLSIDDGDGIKDVSNGAQICLYGTRLDGTGGDSGYRSNACDGRQPIVDYGYSDNFRGWYDVTGCGAANDYCRWVGGASRGDPSLRPLHKSADPAVGMWACVLSNGQDVAAQDPPGWATNKAGTWDLRSHLDFETVPVFPAHPNKRHWNFILKDSFLGCFVDDHARDFAVGNFQYGFTLRSCREHCNQYTYYALQHNGQCFCGNAFQTQSTYHQVSDSECGGPCPGDEAGLCGGEWRNAVYTSRPDL